LRDGTSGRKQNTKNPEDVFGVSEELDTSQMGNSVFAHDQAGHGRAVAPMFGGPERWKQAKIRNIMSALFSHAVRFEIADRNPIQSVRQSAKRKNAPTVLDASELQRLFGELGVREWAMIMIEALTGIRRSELMGLKWKDVDFISNRIHRSPDQ
jgi:integrase